MIAAVAVDRADFAFTSAGHPRAHAVLTRLTISAPPGRPVAAFARNAQRAATDRPTPAIAIPRADLIVRIAEAVHAGPCQIALLPDSLGVARVYRTDAIGTFSGTTLIPGCADDSRSAAVGAGPTELRFNAHPAATITDFAFFATTCHATDTDSVIYRFAAAFAPVVRGRPVRQTGNASSVGTISAAAVRGTRTGLAVRRTRSATAVITIVGTAPLIAAARFAN